MKYIVFSILLTLSFYIKAQKDEQFSIAFYNLENLFDTIDAPNYGDFDWTPGGLKKWDTKRYNFKLSNLAKAISHLDGDNNNAGPSILGVCEVENRSVLEDLIKTEPINKANYGIVHYESPDHRGIDVAVLYRKDHFTSEFSKPYTLSFPGEDYHTRDQLFVKGKLFDETVYIIMNHWPSRRGGPEKSQPRRIAAAELCKSIVDSVLNVDKNANIIVMGDFNDDPTNKSITEVLNATTDKPKIDQAAFYNPVGTLLTKNTGTLCYRSVWYLFDMILMTKPLMDDNGIKFQKAHILNDDFVRVQSGKYEGHPLRTHAGGLYLKGFSDHFGVYTIFSK